MTLFRSAKNKFTSLKKQIPLAMIAGLIGVIFLYVSASGLISITTPWFRTSGDTIAHVDMIYRIYNGDLPKASDGVRYKPFIEMGGGNIYQRAAGHPPLFHILHAPIVGPLLNEGAWKKAIAYGRALNIFFGVLCIFALAWAGWLLGGRRKELFAVAVPALSVLTYRFSRLNTDYALDALLTFWATLTLINLYKILQNGPKVKYLVPLTILSVAGMATKASYGVFLGLSFLTVIVASYIHSSGGRRKRIIQGSIVAAIIAVAVTVSIGWYYFFQNYKASGSLLTPLPSTFTGGRQRQTLGDFIGGSNFWSLFYARFSVNTVISSMISSFAAAGWLTTKMASIRKYLKDSANKWMAIILLLAFLGVVATQIKLAYPYGSINFRYLLPAILPIGLVLAYGLLAFKQLRGQLVALAAIAMAWTTILSIRLGTSEDGLLQGVSEWGKPINKIYIVASQNEVPGYVTSLLFWLFAIGAVLLCVSLSQLSKVKPRR